MNDPATAMPGAGTQILTTLLTMFLGPLGAVMLSTWLAPEADLVHALAGVIAGAAWFLGFLAWLGGAFLSLLTRSGRKQARSGRPPKGTSGFIFTAAVGGAGAGVLTAIAADAFVASLLIIFLAFVSWGYVLHRLAKAGYLPFIEEN